MAGHLADFMAVFGVPAAAFMLCLIPPMILEELELHRTKKKRPTGGQDRERRRGKIYKFRIAEREGKSKCSVTILTTTPTGF
jgi:hypothetical protein